MTSMLFFASSCSILLFYFQTLRKTLYFTLRSQQKGGINASSETWTHHMVAAEAQMNEKGFRDIIYLENKILRFNRGSVCPQSIQSMRSQAPH